MKTLTSIALFVPLFFGCGGDEKDSGATDSGDIVSDSGDTDSGDTDSGDTDTNDTDTDSGGTGNPELLKYEGTWIGTIVMEGSAPSMGMTDSCAGTITLAVDSTDVSKEITGSFDCTWAGAFAATASKYGDGKVEGGIDPNDFSLAGQAWYGPIEITWSGQFDSQEVGSGSWEGIQPADSAAGRPEIHHNGQFNLQKQ
jgi:hypothetical protein